MGSFGMDWSQRGSMLWDWENLSPIGANSNDNPTISLQAEPKFACFEATGHESVHSSCGTFSSNSNMGYCSSKSSIASIDSSPKPRDTVELNFALVKVLGKGTDHKTALGKVDDARSSLSSVIAVSSGEPVIGLKLGKRTYFEDACGEQSAKNSHLGTSAVTPTTTSTKKAKVAQTAQNVYCQVEGCKFDLSSAKNYHRKHRVCEAHSKAPKVIVNGLERRFCQQCSQFHALSEFDQIKRSCRRRLNDHNARRRKQQPDAISFGASRLSTMFYDTRQRTSIVFGQAHNSPMRSWTSSSWDNPRGGFKFAETTSHNMAVMCSMLSQLSRANSSITGIPSIEASVAANLNGAPDLQRALSLLSNNSADASSDQPISQLHPALVTIASSYNPVVQGSSGLWQDGTALDHEARFQAFDPVSNRSPIAAPHQLHLKLPAYDSSPSRYDQMN